MQFLDRAPSPEENRLHEIIGRLHILSVKIVDEVDENDTELNRFLDSVEKAKVDPIDALAKSKNSPSEGDFFRSYIRENDVEFYKAIGAFIAAGWRVLFLSGRYEKNYMYLYNQMGDKYIESGKGIAQRLQELCPIPQYSKADQIPSYTLRIGGLMYSLLKLYSAEYGDN